MKKILLKKNVLKAHLIRENNIVKIKIALLLGDTVNADFAHKEGMKDFDYLIKQIRSQEFPLHSVNVEGLENYFTDAEYVTEWREYFLEHYGTQNYDELKPSASFP